jgi:hypothetical protein
MEVPRLLVNVNARVLTLAIQLLAASSVKQANSVGEVMSVWHVHLLIYTEVRLWAAVINQIVGACLDTQDQHHPIRPTYFKEILYCQDQTPVLHVLQGRTKASLEVLRALRVLLAKRRWLEALPRAIAVTS